MKLSVVERLISASDRADDALSCKGCEKPSTPVKLALPCSHLLCLECIQADFCPHCRVRIDQITELPAISDATKAMAELATQLKELAEPLITERTRLDQLKSALTAQLANLPPKPTTVCDPCQHPSFKAWAYQNDERCQLEEMLRRTEKKLSLL